MLERRRDLDLAQEPCGTERRRDIGLEHLDRYLATVLLILSQVHRGHATGAQFPFDGVTINEGSLQAGEIVWHGR